MERVGTVPVGQVGAVRRDQSIQLARSAAFRLWMRIGRHVDWIARKVPESDRTGGECAAALAVRGSDEPLAACGSNVKTGVLDREAEVATFFPSQQIPTVE